MTTLPARGREGTTTKKEYRMISIRYAGWRLLGRLCRITPSLDEWCYQLVVRRAFRECMKNPEFREELDRWVPLESGEGQVILQRITAA